MKSRDIEKIRVAAQKLRTAICSQTAPPSFPTADEDALCDAIDAIIDAVFNEMTIELRRSDLAPSFHAPKDEKK